MHNDWSEKVVVFEEPTLMAIGVEGMLALADKTSVGVFKLVWWGAPEDITAATAPLGALVGSDAEVVSSLEIAIEVLPSGASKAAGMAIALGLLGVGPGDVLALGDGENDLTMLQEVHHAGGVSVAMGNAMPRVKPMASFVGPTNEENGVAEAVRHFVLGEPSDKFTKSAA